MEAEGLANATPVIWEMALLLEGDTTPVVGKKVG
jgi:hypothetical protein